MGLFRVATTLPHYAIRRARASALRAIGFAVRGLPAAAAIAGAYCRGYAAAALAPPPLVPSRRSPSALRSRRPAPSKTPPRRGYAAALSGERWAPPRRAAAPAFFVLFALASLGSPPSRGACGLRRGGAPAPLPRRVAPTPRERFSFRLRVPLNSRPVGLP